MLMVAPEPQTRPYPFLPYPTVQPEKKKIASTLIPLVCCNMGKEHKVKKCNMGVHVCPALCGKKEKATIRLRSMYV